VQAPDGPVAAFGFCPGGSESNSCATPQVIVTRHSHKLSWSAVADIHFGAGSFPYRVTAGPGSIIGSSDPIFHIFLGCPSMCPYTSSFIGDSTNGWEALTFNTRRAAAAWMATVSRIGPLALRDRHVIGLDNTCGVEAAAGVCSVPFTYTWDSKAMVRG
jgi:hypothetical protein